MDDSDVTGFQGYRVSQIRLGPVDSPMMTLLYCMNAITEEHKIKSCYFILDEVTIVHLEGSSYHIVSSKRKKIEIVILSMKI